GTAPERAAARGSGGALLQPGARDQESARVDSQLGGAVVAFFAVQSGREVPRESHRARKRPAVTAPVGVPRLLARARDRVSHGRSATGCRGRGPARAP